MRALAMASGSTLSQLAIKLIKESPMYSEGVRTDHSGLLLLKPDATHQRLASGILAFLRAHGFRLVTQQRRSISRDVRYQLYRPDVNPWNTNWSLGGVLYTLGPATVMQLWQHRIAPGYASASEYLARRLKGHHDPLRSAPGTIRGEFNAVNRALNLVHAPDDSASMRRELSILMESGDDAAEPGPREAEGPAPVLDFESLILRVHERLLGDAGRRLIAGLRATLATAAGRQARNAVLVSVLEAVCDLASQRRGELASLSVQLSDRSRFARLDYDAIFAHLVDAGLELDGWSRYVLHTSLYYHGVGE
jgi:nucleoside diphosphate kinase